MYSSGFPQGELGRLEEVFGDEESGMAFGDGSGVVGGVFDDGGAFLVGVKEVLRPVGEGGEVASRRLR